MDKCLFCKIIKGEIPCDKVYEDDLVIAFRDIAPVAPFHILVVPKSHIMSANELNESNVSVVAHIYVTARNLAEELGFADSGYRIVNNCGADGGQTVGHLHFHIIAGRAGGSMY